MHLLPQLGKRKRLNRFIITKNVLLIVFQYLEWRLMFKSAIYFGKEVFSVVEETTSGHSI